MKNSFLLDNNVYRPLVQSKNGVAIDNFNLSIRKHKILNRIPSKDIHYSLTPFSIMEALGIIIPQLKVELPEKMRIKKNIKKLLNLLSMKLKNFIQV